MKKLFIAAVVLFSFTSGVVHADGTKKPDPYRTSIEQANHQPLSAQPSRFSEVSSDFNLKD